MPVNPYPITNPYGIPIFGAGYDAGPIPEPLVVSKYKKPREPTLGDKYKELQEFLNKIKD